ncbi:hypothetical protein B6U91_01395, partial [Candidatus Pacearchaeota archaeon ex4484_71]
MKKNKMNSEEKALLKKVKKEISKGIISVEEIEVKGIFVLNDDDGTSCIYNLEKDVRSYGFSTEKGWEYHKESKTFILNDFDGTSCIYNLE